MKTRTITCPNCNQTASGNFCSHCGTPIMSACPSCGAGVQPGSRACQACGASLTARAATSKWNVQTWLPWAAFGVAAVALVVALLPAADRPDRAPEIMPMPRPLSSVLPRPGASVDLSSMTPREAADRLFNRVMAASERGDKNEALQFVPMALQAYDGLGTLDNDARYHVALIHLTAGDMKKARAQIDSIRKTAPGHLLATLLEYEIAERGGNPDAAARAVKTFLAAYDAEIVTGRSEYQDHLNTIERFRTTAQAKTAGKK